MPGFVIIAAGQSSLQDYYHSHCAMQQDFASQKHLLDQKFESSSRPVPRDPSQISGQILGFPISMAARPMLCPISLACSVNAFI
jgi:hypothetical protein